MKVGKGGVRKRTQAGEVEIHSRVLEIKLWENPVIPLSHKYYSAGDTITVVPDQSGNLIGRDPTDFLDPDFTPKMPIRSYTLGEPYRMPVMD